MNCNVRQKRIDGIPRVSEMIQKIGKGIALVFRADNLYKTFGKFKQK
jgi:hypothetical protein